MSTPRHITGSHCCPKTNNNDQDFFVCCCCCRFSIKTSDSLTHGHTQNTNLHAAFSDKRADTSTLYGVSAATSAQCILPDPTRATPHAPSWGTRHLFSFPLSTILLSSSILISICDVHVFMMQKVEKMVLEVSSSAAVVVCCFICC